MQNAYLFKVLLLAAMFAALLMLYIADDRKNKNLDPVLHLATKRVVVGMALVFLGFIFILMNAKAVLVGVLVIPGAYIWAKNDRVRRSSKLSFDADKALIAKRKHEEKVRKKLAKKKENTVRAASCARPGAKEKKA